LSMVSNLEISSFLNEIRVNAFSGFLDRTHLSHEPHVAAAYESAAMV
jgi:hypothetical protein